VFKESHRVRRELARQQVVDALRQTVRPRMVVELGPGEHLLIDRPDRPDGVRYVTVDLVAVQNAQRHVVADVEAGVPLSAASVDVLIACELLEHVFDVPRFLDECRRIIRPGGFMVLTTPNLAALQDRLAFLLGRSPRHVSALHPYLRFHIRPFTHSSLTQALEASGFRAETFCTNFVVWRSESRGTIRIRSLGRLVPGLGSSLIVLVRRTSRAGKGRESFPRTGVSALVRRVFDRRRRQNRDS
jgi:SAM-dependent methyltransferase